MNEQGVYGFVERPGGLFFCGDRVSIKKDEVERSVHRIMSKHGNFDNEEVMRSLVNDLKKELFVVRNLYFSNEENDCLLVLESSDGYNVRVWSKHAYHVPQKQGET